MMTKVTAITLLVACSVVCGLAATGSPAPSAMNASQATSKNDPSVWDAINKAHNNIILLQCRGGPGYEFESLGFRSTAGGDTRVALSMTFAASQAAAGTKNEKLEPGTCAPSDRPLTGSEPRKVHFVTAALSHPWIGPINATPRAAEYFPDVRSIADYLKDPAHYWTFNAENTTRGYFDSWVHQYWSDVSSGRPGGSNAGDARSLTLSHWLVRASASGGIAGGTRQVSINAEGHMQASSSSGNVRCSADLPATTVQRIEAALARAHADKWPASYVQKGNASGCCDQFKFLLHVEQADAQGRRTSAETFWFNDSASLVDEGVSALFKLVYDTKNACSTF